MRTLLIPLFVAVLPAAAAAPDSQVTEIEQRLASQGADSVNAWLAGNWGSAMLPLNRKTAACEPRALHLAVRLSRSGNVRATQAHVDALREATGTCMVDVLTRAATREELTKVCASASAWGVMQTVRELRRRIATIDADDLLRASAIGTTCRAAYLHELETTRVVFKSTPPPVKPSR